MNKKDAEKIAPLVNSRGATDALEHYLNIRIEFQKSALLYATDFHQVLKAQAAIAELERFKHLRNEVNNSDKD